MADVTPRDGNDRYARDRSTAERAQMFLIGALALALVLVVLALVLNSAIYTENLATRGSNGASVDATVQARADAQRGVGDVVEHSNRKYAAYADQIAAVQAELPALEALYMRYEASDGRMLSLTYVTGSDERGTRIHQDTVADFQADIDLDNIGESSWTLVEQTPAVRNFRLSVPDRSTLAGTKTDAFRIIFDPDPATSGDERTVYLYNDGGTTVVAADGSDGSRGTCRDATGGGTALDVTAATVEGERCPALEFLGDIPNDFDIQFDRGGNAKGTYELTVKQGGSTSVPSNPYASGNPAANDAVYGITVHLYARSSDITYETDIRVAPGERNA